MKTHTLVQAKLPMVLDLENYKFYINYFGLMPYLVNKDNQNNLAYVDFQNIKPSLKMSIRRNLLNTLKLRAVSYRLAEPQNLQRVSLTEADRKAGRLKNSFKEDG